MRNGLSLFTGLLILASSLAALPVCAAEHNHEDIERSDDRMDMTHPMTGAFGPYAMTREASGTSWQPDSTPHDGVHFRAGDWSLMAHGFVNGIYDNQGGKRGNDQAFSTS